MTDCKAYLRELTHTAQQVLDQDLAALERMPERSRIERYNEIKANEEELVWDYGRDCPDFLTETEEARVRSDCRLARLLIAASFYADGSVPQALEDDFIEAELQAVVDFDRYKQFDALDEEQIEQRIRRMEGEVYELVQDYTSTQIGNMDELIENPDVQQDVIERLVDRYEERRERIRQGFFIYVETHGLEHMVEQIEAAVEAVADASNAREQIDEEIAEEIEQLSATVDRGYTQDKQQLEQQLREIEGDLASGAADPEQVRQKLQSISELDRSPISELAAGIDRVQQLEEQLNEQITELEDVRRDAQQADREVAREEATQVVEDEIERLKNKRDDVRSDVEQLQAERDDIEATRERIEQQYQSLEQRVDNIETSVDTEAGIEGEGVVTASMARLFEMDYIGRFDTSIREVKQVMLPDGQFDVPDNYWAGRSTHQNKQPQMQSLLDEHSGGGVESYPVNKSSRYHVTTSAFMRLSDQLEMVIQAIVYSHLDAYAINEFDSQPATLDDLLRVVSETVAEASQRNVQYLLGIASPTGWTDRVQEEVIEDEFARTHYGRFVSVCLINLRDGSMMYDESDSLITDNISLFDRVTATEQLDTCISTIQTEYLEAPSRDTVFLTEVSEDTLFKQHVIKQAFDQLESDGVAEQFYIEEDGLALHAL